MWESTKNALKGAKDATGIEISVGPVGVNPVK